jgi:chromosome partitioning protein
VRTIAIVNQKGGCGKTTTAINLSAILAARGQRTLLVDMDPQAHCAAGLGVPENCVEYGIADALVSEPEQLPPRDSWIWEVCRNLDLSPSTMKLATLEAPGGGLHDLPDKDRRLQKLLRTLSDVYDTCLIDCPPTIGLLTFNALRAAREALVPVETSFFALKGAERQWETLHRLIRHIDRPILCRMLPSIHDPGSPISNDILSALHRQFPGFVLPTVIRHHETVREATSFGQPVVEYAYGSEAHQDFEALADWLDANIPAPVYEPEPGEMPSNISITPSRQMPVLNAPKPAAAPPPDADTMPSATPLRPASTHRIVPRLDQNDEQPSTRAAELVKRVQAIARQTVEEGQRLTERVRTLVRPDYLPDPPNLAQKATGLTDVSQDPNTATVVKPPLPARPVLKEDGHIPVAPVQLNRPVEHLYGVRRTARGAVFVQPLSIGECIFVAGDFNGWSSTATPMRRNPALGVFEAVVDLAPGNHQYRLIVDGIWKADPYNGEQTINEHGEPNSVVTVQEASATP